MLNRFAVTGRLHTDPGRDRAPRPPQPHRRRSRIPGRRRTTAWSPRLPPGVVTTPDGWVLTVVANDETQLPVAPLTTAVSSREYLVGGTFTGTVTGSGKTSLSGGTLEAGYQIGCGIELGQVRLIGQAGIGTSGSSLTGGIVPTGVTFPLSGTIEIHRSPARCPPSRSTRRSTRPRPCVSR